MPVVSAPLARKTEKQVRVLAIFALVTPLRLHLIEGGPIEIDAAAVCSTQYAVRPVDEITRAQANAPA
jgi:hypothetical protein